MPAMSCIVLQSPAWVVGLFPDVTLVSRPVCFRGHYVVWYSGQAGGEKQLTSVSSCSVSTIGVVVVDVSGDSTAMCSVNFDLRTCFFRVNFAATCPAAAWFSDLDVSP